MKNNLPKIDINTKREFLKSLFGEIALAMPASEIDERLGKLSEEELDLLTLIAQEQADYSRGIDNLMQEYAPQELKKIERELDKEEELEKEKKTKEYAKRFEYIDEAYNKLEKQLEEIKNEEIELISKAAIENAVDEKDSTGEGL